MEFLRRESIRPQQVDPCNRDAASRFQTPPAALPDGINEYGTNSFLSSLSPGGFPPNPPPVSHDTPRTELPASARFDLEERGEQVEKTERRIGMDEKAEG